MKTFAELREAIKGKIKLKPGEKEIARGSKKGARKKDAPEIVITKKGNKFNLYFNGELAQKDIRSEKEAKKAMQDMLKMLG